MAPFQEDSIDNHVPIAGSYELCTQQKDPAVDSHPMTAEISTDEKSKEKQRPSATPGSTQSRTGAGANEEHFQPKSILRRSSIDNSDTNAEGSNSLIVMPSHWPFKQRSIQFPPDSSIVTHVHTRPRTHILDVPTLYYSTREIRRFKSEYRQVQRTQALAKERMERHKALQQGDLVGISSNVDEESRHSSRSVQKQQHDNTFWRSKVPRRWHVSSRSTSSSCESSNTRHSAARSVTQSDATQAELDPLNDGSNVDLSSSIYDDSDSDDGDSECDTRENKVSSKSTPAKHTPHSGGGIFSSVFDVASEAVSILNGPSSRFHHYQQHYNGAVCKTTLAAKSHENKQCLVDTLYLF